MRDGGASEVQPSSETTSAHASAFFRVDDVLNASHTWQHLPPIFMPDVAWLRSAVRRTCDEEYSTLTTFLKLFRHICSTGGLFVDSGANEGTWSLLAAAHGCKVHAIEPQPYCSRIIAAAARRSGLTLTQDTVVFAEYETELTRPCVPVDMCRGTASYTHGKVTDIRDRKWAANASSGCQTVEATTLDELLPGTTTSLDLWHLDVEGAELVALRSARRLLRERRIKRVMMEIDSRQRWRLNVKDKLTIDATLAEVALIFRGWRCVFPCNRHDHGTPPFVWPTHFTWGAKRDECSNVYCVAPGVADDAFHDAFHLRPSASRPRAHVEPCDRARERGPQQHLPNIK
jgi:FkbM family methyltransferase